jgi:ribosomal protein S18 acetylase RimI-like enzyme
MAAIELARAGDLDALAPIPHPRREDVASAIARGRCWVIRTSNEMAAHLVLGHPFFGHPFVETLYVAEGCRRQGHGRALLRHALALHAGRKLFTSTNTSNAAMRALLAAEGFEQCGWIDNLDPGDPELVFCRLA